MDPTEPLDETQRTPDALRRWSGPTRPETGPMKFYDDWRGLFVRGDDCLRWRAILESFIATGHMLRQHAEALRELFSAADELEYRDDVQRVVGARIAKED